ncbi:RNA methyltransferase [Coprothermobacteraceae bacterium]|nr:RNA methyltransferase [Coprothermobacteraceae bacterium]
MRRYRFFVRPELVKLESGVVLVDDSLRAYLENILRGGESAELVAFDGSGTEYVVQWVPDRKELRIVERRNACLDKGFKLAVFQGVPKGTFMEDVISFCAQVGVDDVYPLLTARSVSRQVGSAKLNRWRRLAEEASKVGGFCHVTRIGEPMTLEESLATLRSYDLVLFLYENAHKPLRELANVILEARSIALVIGPEGGFDIAEAELLRAVGQEVSLGPVIYRSRWAAATACVIVNYIKGLAG